MSAVHAIMIGGSLLIGLVASVTALQAGPDGVAWSPPGAAAPSVLAASGPGSPGGAPPDGARRPPTGRAW